MITQREARETTTLVTLYKKKLETALNIYIKKNNRKNVARVYFDTHSRHGD